MTETKSSVDTLLAHVADKPVAMARLALQLLSAGQRARAQELCERAIALAPENGEVHALGAIVFSHGVGRWFFNMVRDHARHVAYEDALRRAITPGCRVLDIGTGTGLLAMMSARLGAAEVVTCEANEAIANMATEVIARNGYADRVRVVGKRSSDLDPEIDINAPVDIVVWDILGSDLIGAGALPVVEHAVRSFLRPGGRLIPARGAIRVALAEYTGDTDQQMGVVEGFDLSPFNRLAVPNYQLPPAAKGLTVCSEAGTLFDFDFQSGGPFPGAQREISLTSIGGRVNGIAQWIRFEFDDHIRYENSPALVASSAFAVVFSRLPTPLETQLGDRLSVCGAHDRGSPRIWVKSTNYTKR